MTTQDIFKCVKGLLGLCLMMFTMSSCTYDYFVDENNVRLFVPQIKEQTIDNLYVAFHDKGGAHVLTRHIEAPFDKDDLMKNGILRFKLPYGDYSVTCFANAAIDGLTSGKRFEESFGQQRSRQRGDIFDAYATDPRVFLTEATVYPIGHPNSQDSIKVNMSDSRRVKGRVTIKCIGLPTSAKRIDTYYTGLSTRYNFNGQLARFTEQDMLFSGSYPVVAAADGTVTLDVNIVMPSAGQSYGMVTSPAEEIVAPIEFRGDIYDADDKLLGRLTYTKEDFDALPNERRPTDKEGQPLTELVLHPKQEIILTFKDLFFYSAGISGWGDIVSPDDDDIIP